MRYAVARYYPAAVISFVTIAPADFAGYQKHKVDIGHISRSHYTTRQLDRFEKDHIIQIIAVNREINRLNNIPTLGLTTQTVSWHTKVLKIRASGALRFIKYSLVDGLHGTKETKKVWCRQIHVAFIKEVRQLD